MNNNWLLLHCMNSSRNTTIGYRLENQLNSLFIVEVYIIVQVHWYWKHCTKRIIINMPTGRLTENRTKQKTHSCT